MGDGLNSQNIDKKFAFVILHYMAIDETMACIESIFYYSKQIDKYEIVVVDNGSSNKTGKILKEEYEDKSNVHVLLLKENKGFAKGNNVGYLFAKKQLQCDFICMLNNDTLLLQRNFIDKCYEIYENHKCAVIGPAIIKKDGTIQSIRGNFHTKRYYILHRNIIKFERILSRTGLDTIKIAQAAGKLFDCIKYKLINSEKLGPMEEHKNIILHGCCWIFTPQFVKLFDGINDKTFLYREEELLYLLLIKNKLQCLYQPSLRICHIEDAATDMIINTSKEKREFIYKNEIVSMKILIDEMCDMNI